MIFLLLACEAPGTMSAVSDALAGNAEAAGEPALRLTTALAGVLAETCNVGDIAGYTFTGRSAAQMGVTGIDVSTNDTQFIWTAEDVGLDGEDGTLEYTTDSSAENFAVAYNSATVRYTAGFETKNCDDEGVIIAGTGTWTGSYVVTLSILGVAPTNGLSFSPTTADYPSGGWLKADEEDWEIVLDDAGTLPVDAETWSGVATGKGWTGDVEVPWP